MACKQRLPHPIPEGELWVVGFRLPGFDEYVFQYEPLGKKVRVKNETVVEVDGSTLQVNFEGARTIEGLFDMIQDAIDQSAIIANVLNCSYYSDSP